jgi:hypothetical protein
MFEYQKRPHRRSYRQALKANLPLLGIGLIVITTMVVAMFFAAMPAMK